MPSRASASDIRMVDLAGQYARIKSEIDAAISQVLHSTAFIQGPEVQEFEAKLAAFTGSAHVISCANGTDALQLAMMALALKPSDEVILPVHTYVATAEVIALLGLTPAFIDVREDTFTLDVDQLEGKITAKTKAIVPVHLYGQCADMGPLLDMAARHKLFVIEDAAQSLGARYLFPDKSSRYSGTLGHVGATSFFPSKNLGCFGDGGALFTQDPELAARLRRMANHGQSAKYIHDSIGINSRLDTLQAAILQVKLKYLHEYEAARRKVADHYDEALKNLDWLERPVRSPNSTHVFHQYTLRVLNGKRDDLKNYLQGKAIPSMIYYPVPLHRQKAYRQFVSQGQVYPVTEQLSNQVLSLPIHTEMTESQLSYICEAIRAFPA